MKRVILSAIGCLITAAVTASPVSAAGMGCGPTVDSTPYGHRSYSTRRYQSRRFQQPIRLQRRADEKGYYLTIVPGEFDPASIKVETQGRSVLIHRALSSQSNRQDDRGGYRFSHRTSSFNRRLTLPWDADGASMTRSDEAGEIRVFFPRRQEP